MSSHAILSVAWLTRQGAPPKDCGDVSSSPDKDSVCFDLWLLLDERMLSTLVAILD